MALNRATVPGMRPLVGVGLKMFLGYAASVDYLQALADSASDLSAADVFVLPSFPVLAEARRVLAGTTVVYGAQDAHWEDRGAFTGCVSPGMLAELGCTYVEVGHAERRRLFGETDDIVAAKAAACMEHGLVPIVCVGESTHTQDAPPVVTEQVMTVLDRTDPDRPLVVAYEPVWAIGATKPAGPDWVRAVMDTLRPAASSRSAHVTFLYGGSVAADNASAFSDAGIDGLFVGRSALDLGALTSIVNGFGGSR